MVVQRGREGLLLWVRLLLLMLLLGRLEMLLLVLLMLLVLWRGCWRLMLRGMVLLMMVMVLVVVLLVRRELLTGKIKSAETLGQWGQSRQGHRDAVIVLVAVDKLPKNQALFNSRLFNKTLSTILCNFFFPRYFQTHPKTRFPHDSTTFGLF